MYRYRHGNSLLIIAAKHRFPVLFCNRQQVTGFSCATMHPPSALCCRPGMGTHVMENGIILCSVEQSSSLSLQLVAAAGFLRV